MKNRIIIYFTILLIFSSVASYFIARYYIDKKYEYNKHVFDNSKELKITKIDTVRLVNFRIDTIKTVKYVDTLELASHELIHKDDTVYGIVYVPITTHKIEEKGVFEAIISGYRLHIDSIYVYPKTEIYERIVKNENENNRFNIDLNTSAVYFDGYYAKVAINNNYRFLYLNTGVLYDLNIKKLAPYVEAGVRFRLN